MGQSRQFCGVGLRAGSWLAAQYRVIWLPTRPAKAMLFGVPSNRRVTFFWDAYIEASIHQTSHHLPAAG